MKTRLFFLLFLSAFSGNGVLAQSNHCTFKPPFYRIPFGAGPVQDVNTATLAYYNRVASSCPTDGHYAFVSSTANCFRGDWHTLAEDHTPGDAGGNMLLVNSAYNSGVFLTTKVKGFKGATTYQFGVWLMNVCKPSDKCPFPLLPNLSIRLQTLAGRTVALFTTGELQRREMPYWTQHRAQFTVPSSETELVLTLANNSPGGCGNDFALDDITFQECVKPDPAKVVEIKKQPVVVASKKLPVPKQEQKKATPSPLPAVRKNPSVTVSKKEKEGLPVNQQGLKPQALAFLPVPPVIKQRANPLARHIETGSGEILLQLYDNGEIDGDTVSIYHNNRLIISEQRLSQKPISFRIQVDEAQPHHELVMVAHNLGTIPPNTSLMIITTKEKRYQVFISSTEQKNAKVVIDLREE